MMSLNLKARNDMTLECYIKAITTCQYHGNDLALLVLSKMLKMTIAVLHLEYIWLSHLDANLRDANIVLVMNLQEVYSGTGNYL